MGLDKQGGMELAPNVATSIFTSASGTASNQNFFSMVGPFNATLTGGWSGLGGMMSLQASFDGGNTFIPVVVNESLAGSTGSYTTNVCVRINQPEPGVFYRWQPTTTLVTSGAQNCSARISGGSRVS